ncbi:hypothetical protein FCH79_09625 [Pseudomonas koreensis]|uniref:hypothetical protein n=1 Tax=Pseudomonas TaxID=286 RepID=UPI0005972771|nr:MULTISPECIES: hypothetical protein [Pseudomonas]KIK84386.1 hypothetical protein OC71_20780 [Pseudomonas sp. W15Feb9B]NTZ95578.1 hypothetical protein [Pseudomonas koreensis]
MADRIYKKLEGMNVEYVSGRLEENLKERSIRYEVTFELELDFTHFVHMAHVFIPGYLDNPVNAIRPELDGLAYHYAYNYLFGTEEDIRDNQALFRLFTSPRNYMDKWATGRDLEVRYGKPQFEAVGPKLRITAHRDFRALEGRRQIEIGDLPVMQFHWALNLMEGHMEVPQIRAPQTRVVLMYMDEDFVEIDGEQLFRGTRYIDSKQLGFGEISPKQILIAQ